MPPRVYEKYIRIRSSEKTRAAQAGPLFTEPISIFRVVWLALPALWGLPNVDDAFQHSIRYFVLFIVCGHRPGQRLKMCRLTAFAIALLMCAAYSLDAQTNTAIFDANGNAVTAQLR